MGNTGGSGNTYHDTVQTLGGYLEQSGTFIGGTSFEDGVVMLTLLYPGKRTPDAVILHLKPASFSVEENNRSTVQQTATGAFLTAFGLGLGAITISGNTGWRIANKIPGKIVDGYRVFIALRNLLRDYANKCATEGAKDVELILYSTVPSDYGAWRVTWKQMRAQQNKQQPLLIQYDVQFDVIQDLLGPVHASPISQILILGRGGFREQGEQDVAALNTNFQAVLSVAATLELNTTPSGKEKADRYYTPVSGDTLEKIAALFSDTSVDAIKNDPENKLKNLVTLSTSVSLHIPYLSQIKRKHKSQERKEKDAKKAANKQAEAQTRIENPGVVTLDI